ncbi:hypothetical protein BKA03_001521 [Demequina lutea]|uniref:Uncharacterized protein n=1 Tax=Demequina lutea TaxID=431489 RepID=A0A7Z0CK25_9MICO|nr:hypothetical protein [Demequina lutea]
MSFATQQDVTGAGFERFARASGELVAARPLAAGV